jgi:hypothetical protein
VAAGVVALLRLAADFLAENGDPSLHRKPTDAKGFYAVYCGLIVVAAGLILTPGAPLGLLPNAVQTLAGVLLPSATVFLLLLCNDRAVLGPWSNTRVMNLFTGAVIAALVMLSIILTASVLFPEATNETVMLSILGGGTVLALLTAFFSGAFRKTEGEKSQKSVGRRSLDKWRMPPLTELPPSELSNASKIWMGVLRAYLFIAGGLVLLRIVSLAVMHWLQSKLEILCRLSRTPRSTSLVPSPSAMS